MPPILAQRLTLISSNYPCLEHIFIVPKVFEPLKFDCTKYFTRLLVSFWKGSPCCNIYYCALSDMFAVFCLFLVYYCVIHLCIGIMTINLFDLILSDVAFRNDQKHALLARQASPYLHCFWSRLINSISKDTNMVFCIS